MYQEKEEKNKGITLISLVLTIIILLILVGVSLSLIVGETGIVERASKTKNVTETSELQEKIKIAAMAAQVQGLGKIPSTEVLKSELDSAIGTDYTIEETEDGWTVIANKSAFNIDRNGGTEETEYFDSEEWDKTAADEDCFYWASDDPASDDYGTVIGYTAKIQDYTLLRYPRRVTKIEFKGLDGNGGNSTYSDGVTVEASRNFTNNILKVEIPNTVRYIGHYGFCGDSAWSSFSKMQEIVLPNSAISLAWTAFSNCSSLKSITIPNGVTSIGDSGFYECSSLTSIIIPNSVTSIGFGAFYGCSSLKSITIPNSVTSIGNRAFYECSSLTNITIPNSVTSIGESAFSGCSSLTNITIQNGIKKIEACTFAGCSSIGEIIIPNSVKIINHYAFGRCNGLTRIFIPKEVLTIEGPSSYSEGPNVIYEDFVFENCASNLQIYTDATSPNPGWANKWNYYSDEGELTVHYGVSLEEFNNLD